VSQVVLVDRGSQFEAERERPLTARPNRCAQRAILQIPKSRATCLGLIFFLACVVAVRPSIVLAQVAVIDREYEIKAAYLYNFGKYVEWPDAPKPGTEANSPFLIGIVGMNPFGNALADVAKAKQLGKRKIVLYELRTIDDYRPCQMLFFPKNAPESLVSSVIAKSDSAPILLVGERSGFAAAARGSVNFYVEANNIKFEINPDAASKRGLRISSKLLQLGRIVSASASR
jgi:hypothetical protein